MTAELQAQLAAREADIVALREELDETNKGVVALYAELDDKAARSARGHRAQEPLSFLHEPRVPHAAHLDDQHHRHPAVAPRRAADIRAAEAGGIHPQLRRASSPTWWTTCSTSPRSRPGASPSRPNGSRWWICSSALRGMFKPIVASTSISLVFDEPQGDIKLFTDDKKLSQILRNFISNALKFTPEGEVRVTARTARRTIAWSSRSPTPASASRAEHVPNLFADFVQLDVRLQKRLRGSGLGLSLARKFAELLGGEVHVAERARQGIALLGGAADEPGRGARRAGRRMSAVASNKITNQKILVVDDNPASLYSTSRILRSGGFRSDRSDHGHRCAGRRRAGRRPHRARHQPAGHRRPGSVPPAARAQPHGLSTHRAPDGDLRRPRRSSAGPVRRR